MTWKSIPLKRLLLFPLKYGANESGFPFEENLFRYIRITDINENGELRQENCLSLPNSIGELYTLNDEDILFARSGASVGKSFYFKREYGKCCFAGYLIKATFNKKKVIPRYLYWYFNSFDYWDFINRVQIQATIQNVSAEKYNEFLIQMPDEIITQTQIVAFLDYETSKIDTLIEKQEQLISLLKEKRQAVISHAVTKGITPNVEMKDSGVEWLGLIPKHWEVKRFKWLFEIKKNIAKKLGYEILSITQRGIKIKDIESNEGQLSSDYSKYQLVSKGDFAMNQMDLLTGFVDISNYNGVTSPDYRVFKIRSQKYHPQYYLYLLQMGYLDKLFFPFGQGAAQMGRWRLPTEAFNEFMATVPPVAEQIKIASYISDSHSKFNELEAKAMKAVSLLKERRTALISAAVTGKIDVRDWKPPKIKRKTWIE